MRKSSDFTCKTKISCLKMFRFHTLFLCEMICEMICDITWEVIVRVPLLTFGSSFTLLAFQARRLSHKDHIEPEGGMWTKNGEKLNGTILSKLGGKLFFSRPFPVCSRTSRSNNNWSLRNCFVFVFIICIAELLFWLLVGYYFCLIVLLSFFFKKKKEKEKEKQPKKKKRQKVKWPLTLS